MESNIYDQKLECALELFKGGKNTKSMPAHAGDGNNQGRQSGKN